MTPSGGAFVPSTQTPTERAVFFASLINAALTADSLRAALQLTAWSIQDELACEGVYFLRSRASEPGGEPMLELVAHAGAPPTTSGFARLKRSMSLQPPYPTARLAWIDTSGSPEQLHSLTYAFLHGIDADEPILVTYRTGEATEAHEQALVDIATVLSPALAAVSRSERLRSEVIDARRLVQDTKAERRARKAFIANMSHDLRTPLGVITGFAQLLELEDLPARPRGHVKQILTASDRLLGLINQVLALTEIDSGKFTVQLQLTDLHQLLLECLDDMRPAAREKRIVLEGPPDGISVWAHTDPYRAKQIVHNLLSNAIKFNVRGGRVGVRLDAPTARTVAVHVTDTGSGMSAAQLARAFNPFERLDVDGDTPGSGLGLAVSRALATALGGTVTADSRVARGSTFTLTLPRAQPLSMPTEATDE